SQPGTQTSCQYYTLHTILLQVLKETFRFLNTPGKQPSFSKLISAETTAKFFKRCTYLITSRSRTVEHHKATPTCTGDLSACSTCLQSGFVDLVHCAITDAACHLLFIAKSKVDYRVDVIYFAFQQSL